LINKPFANITLDDILSLQTNEIEEGKSIDYKQELHLDNKSNKKEFAADITSFANTVGGDLIIGVSEGRGIITEIKGIKINDKDKLRQDIENLLRDIIQPQIMGLEIAFYPFEQKYIMHIRIPQSFNGPHIVNGERFYGRNTTGKYPFDYVEIKQRFILSNQVQERIKNYHIERMMKVKADEGYYETGHGTTILIHVVPIQSFTENVYVSTLTHDRFELAPLYGTSYEPVIQFEGITGIRRGGERASYHHINRQGIIEITDKVLLNRDPSLPILGKTIIERSLMVLPHAFNNLGELGLYGPYLISTAILDVKGRIINHNEFGFSESPIRQNDMIFPSIIITDPTNMDEYEQMLKELLMNAAGYFYTPYTL